ncbi:MAG TPA: hypothetical protein VGL58_05165 [Caulobacteraceae bacterium]|jgi:hypothetical protein
MIWMLAYWVVLLIVLVVGAVGSTGKGGALTLAYFLGLSLIHVPGVLAFLNPLSPAPGRDVTAIGFQMTLLGMTAFVAAAVAASKRRRRREPLGAAPSSRQIAMFDRMGWRTFVLGVFSYFILLPISGRIPSATSVVSAAATTLIIGLWIRLYGAEQARDGRSTLTTLALLPVLPLSTLAVGGFIGFGVSWVLSVLSFLYVVSRRRFWFFVSAPFVVFLGLSLFVTYEGQRTGIRDVVWHQHAGLEDRLERVSTLVTQFEMLDLNNEVQLDALNDRLNQNALVGAGVQRLRSGAVGLKYGGTISPLDLVPRAIWPDKPVVGGSLHVVSAFTGIPFDATTSVGIGSVLEFYMNFGTPGLIIGFAGLGFLLMRLDQAVMKSLGAGDIKALLRSAMPGLLLLQPGGSFLEIAVGVVAAIVAARLIGALPVFGLATAKALGGGARLDPATGATTPS